jgi:hypothetical protein
MEEKKRNRLWNPTQEEEKIIKRVLEKRTKEHKYKKWIMWNPFKYDKELVIDLIQYRRSPKELSTLFGKSEYQLCSIRSEWRQLFPQFVKGRILCKAKIGFKRYCSKTATYKDYCGFHKDWAET